MTGLEERECVQGSKQHPQCVCGSRRLEREGVAWKASESLDYTLSGYRLYKCLKCGKKLYD